MTLSILIRGNLVVWKASQSKYSIEIYTEKQITVKDGSFVVSLEGIPIDQLISISFVQDRILFETTHRVYPVDYTPTLSTPLICFLRPSDRGMFVNHVILHGWLRDFRTISIGTVNILFSRGDYFMSIEHQQGMLSMSSRPVHDHLHLLDIVDGENTTLDLSIFKSFIFDFLIISDTLEPDDNVWFGLIESNICLKSKYVTVYAECSILTRKMLRDTCDTNRYMSCLRPQNEFVS